MTRARRVLVLVLAVAVLAGLAAPPPAHAGSTTADVALGLAAFAVFTQLLAWNAWAAAPAPATVNAPPGVVYMAPPPAPAWPRVVEYPHGWYELRGDGVYVAYQWVWIPRVPPVPPPPPGPVR
jgi:hypothetical protein